MTKRKNMTAGQRQAAMEKRVDQLEMATRISQMLLQQMGNSTNQIGSDISELATRQRDVQYRVLAVQQLLDLDLDKIDAKAEELQIKDFQEASDKEDGEKGYTETDVVAEDSVVIITTAVEDEGAKGILRSKLILSDLGFPQFKEDLLGKTVGDELDADINGTTHKVTVLGIRQKPEEVEEPTGEEDTPTPTGEQDEEPAKEANG